MRITKKGAWIIFLLLVLALLRNYAVAGPADDVQDVRVRVSAATEVLHGQGYWSPALRVGHDGGWGLRIGSLKAPAWASEVPAELIALDDSFKLNSVSFVEADYEACGQRWCGAIGAARLNGLTPMNGTQWNFGVHLRYAIDINWSLVLDHYSHGSAFGIAKDKSNRGWNLLGVAYTF